MEKRIAPHRKKTPLQTIAMKKRGLKGEKKI